MNTHKDAPYVLAVGEEAHQRLEFQNSLIQEKMVQALKTAASIKNLKGATVVDFGCGTSSAYNTLLSFIGPTGQYVGIDASQEQIDFNQKRYPDARYIVGDESAEEAKEALSSANVIYLRYVVMHQKNPRVFLKTLYETLKEGALLIVQEPEETPERKTEMVEKYPFAGDLCDFKQTIGKKLGLDYNFAKQLEEVVKQFQPHVLLHTAEPTYISTLQAKTFLARGIKEVARKNKGLFTEAEIASYLQALSQLPEGENDVWNLDCFHTLIAQKRETL